MVDTGDLKSPGPYRLCGFESHFLYSVSAMAEKSLKRICDIKQSGL